MEGLDFDNILGAEEIDNLFTDEETASGDSTGEASGSKPGDDKEKKQDETTEVVDTEDLFDKPESVGSGKDDNEEQEDAAPEKAGTSPNNFYSSIAKALQEEGIFPDLDEETYNKVSSAEDFRDLVDQQIRAGLDERQKRVDEALNAGVEATEIRNYEGAISYLDSITEDLITKEGEQGEDIRRRLITQDLMNRGYKKERIEREVKKSFDSGSDVEDAKEALDSNKSFFRDKYDSLVKEAKEAAAKEERDRKEKAEKLRKSILEDKDVFGELSVDNVTRRKIYDNIMKPVYKDPDTGEYYTAIQKYEKDNGPDFLKYVGLVFTLTDNFRNMDGLVKGKVKKEVKKGLKELETTLNNTSRNSDGSLNFASGVKDSESYFNGLSLDI